MNLSTRLTALVAIGIFGIGAVVFASQPSAVVDGDSIHLAWYGLARLDGIDTPELHGRCPDEIYRAVTARYILIELLRHRPLDVQILPHRDKYGRLLVKITAAGADVAATLIATGVARPYSGGKRLGWCNGEP